MKDICFTNEKDWFRYRTGAFILKDDKMLFVKSKFGGYFYMIGGGVGLGETSADCIEREVLEETGIEVKVDRLAVVLENFFKGYLWIIRTNGGIVSSKSPPLGKFIFLYFLILGGH